MKVLITGSGGLYGSKLAEKAAGKNYEVYSGYLQDMPAYGTNIRFDVSDHIQVREAFKKANPEVVIHAASLTNVDLCETNKQLAWKINVEGTENVVEAAKACHAFFIYISTDAVFNGEKGRYVETDKPDPINYYGFTKLKAEEAVKANLSGEWCIARASVIYGAAPAAGKINFLLWLLNKLRKNEVAKIVTDQWNSPTLNTSLADMTLEVAERRLTGIYHLSGASRISRYAFAKLVAQTFNLDPNLVIATTSAEFSLPAKRQTDSSLDTQKAQESLENKPLLIEQALEKVKQELACLS